jgi:hypothetical protein
MSLVAVGEWIPHLVSHRLTNNTLFLPGLDSSLKPDACKQLPMEPGMEAIPEAARRHGSWTLWSRSLLMSQLSPWNCFLSSRNVVDTGGSFDLAKGDWY